MSLVSSDSSVVGVAAADGEWTATVGRAGTTVLSAAQEGDGNWNPAAPVVFSLAVLPAPLVATADDKTRSYGMANPPLTMTYTGLKNADVAPATAPAINCAADLTSSPGAYPITLSGGADPNYDIDLRPGVLMVYGAGDTGFRMHITGDNTPPATLHFGESVSALPALDAWDAAAVASLGAHLFCPFVDAPADLHLSRDFRPLPGDGLTRWRLEVGAPSLPQGRSVHSDGAASPETRNRNPESYTLTWNVDAAADGREIWLQELDGFERPVGFPLDMREDNRRFGVAPGTVFEIVYGALQTFDIPLRRGWNAVGTPLLTTAAIGTTDTRQAGGAVVFPAWRWVDNRFARVGPDDPFLPKVGYMILCREDNQTLTVTGLPPGEQLPPLPGWDLASPVAAAVVPEGVVDWHWNPERQFYKPVSEVLPRRAYWRHGNSHARSYLVIDVAPAVIRGVP